MYCWCDIEKLQIILNNLLSNAVKYTPDGGQIDLILKSEDEGIVIEINDTGIGIPEHQIDLIFMPFYQAENSSGKGGTGIGLALTKSLVELHEGKISVVSSSYGSKFLIWLPNDKSIFNSKEYVRFIQPEIVDSTFENEIEEEDILRNIKPVVLVVDDNVDIRKYIEKKLVTNYEVVCARNGREAFEIAVTTIPDIILSDVMMPKMDGIEFCKKN